MLWRTDGRLQIGLGSRAAVIADATTALAQWLVCVDGTRDWAQLAHEATQRAVPPGLACRSLAIAFSIGAIDDAGTMPEELRWTPRSFRESVAGDLAAAAFAYGDSRNANTVVDRRARVRVGLIGEGRLADELREAVRHSGLRADDESPHIRIIASAPHPAMIDAGANGLQPHLPVAVFGDIGHIGPLVVPGSTSCTRCGYLHRRDADPEWPMLTLQLERAMQRIRVAPVDRLLARATAQIAALLVRRWADDPMAVEDWGDQVLEVHLPDGRIERRPAPAHALCGCGWPESSR